MHENPHNDHHNGGHDCHDGQSDQDPPPRNGTQLHHRPSPDDDRCTTRYGKLGDSELHADGGVTQALNGNYVPCKGGVCSSAAAAASNASRSRFNGG
jgi:hypothetical protein